MEVKAIGPHLRLEAETAGLATKELRKVYLEGSEIRGMLYAKGIFLTRD